MFKDFQIIPFKADHIDLMTLRKEQEDCYATPLQLSIHAKTLERSSIYSKTLLYKGRTVLSVGCYKCWGNMYEGWLLVDEYMPILFEKKSLTGVRIARYLLNQFPASATRIQTHVRVDFKEGQRFMELLGFKKEGLMKKYGPTGLDYYLYSKIKEE